MQKGENACFKNPCTVVDHENGEFVTIYENEGIWEYQDTLQPDKWNMGTFTVREADDTVFIMTSSYALEAAVISAFRALHRAVEWIEPKVRRRRNYSFPTRLVKKM